MKKLIILLFLFYSPLAISNNAIHLGGNYNIYGSDKLQDFNIFPKGAGYHFIFSQNFSNVGLELSYRKDKFSSDVRFDETDSKLNVSMISMGLGFYLALNKEILLRGGFAWYRVKNSLGDSITDIQKHAMKEAWGISSDQKYTGYYLGAQYKLLSSRTFDFYSNYMYQRISDEVNNHSFGLGITFKFDLKLSSL